jgi:predicted acylesterase/phospholipase RssA
MEEPMVKRAITLGGGGPAAGLHIGVLEALAAKNITFDVWSLSCIGAWVGIVYNQCGDEENKVDKTYKFFKNGVFRDDESYRRFPINTVFGPDWRSNIKALNNFVTNSDNYKDFLWDPYRMMSSRTPWRFCSISFLTAIKRKSSKNWTRETSIDGYSTKRWRLIHSSVISRP